MYGSTTSSRVILIFSGSFASSQMTSPLPNPAEPEPNRLTTAGCYDPSEEIESRMGLQLLTERRSSQIAGVLSCYDRMLIQGTLPGLCFAEGMTGYLYAHRVRIFDYPRWAQPLREALRENAERLAAENGLEIEFIRRAKSFRKEDK